MLQKDKDHKRRKNTSQGWKNLNYGQYQTQD